MKYFMFNKALDYARGRMENCEYGTRGLSLKQGESRGIFISRVLDGQEKNLVWHRLEMDSDSISDACIQMTVYASETCTVLWEGETRRIGDLIADPGVSAGELLKAFKPYKARHEINPEDTLLHDVKGRYLWVAAELFRQGEESPEIRNIKLEFPKESWMAYLPRIYQEDRESGDFLERFLGIFQTIYQETEERIRSSQRLLDTEGAGEELLQWLAGWMDADSVYLWEEQKLKRLMRNIFSLYRKRGTRQGLIDIITLYTGKEPYIVETFQTEEYRRPEGRRRELERLYGRERSRFYILLPEEALPTAREYQAVMQIVRDMAPAHMEAVVVALKPYLLLGSYSYLGINSRLGQYRPLKLDGRSLLSFTAVGERQGEEE